MTNPVWDFTGYMNDLYLTLYIGFMSMHLVDWVNLIVCTILFVLIVYAIMAAWAVRKMRRELTLRGSRMSGGKARRTWLRNYKTDKIRQVFEADYIKGVISLHEYNTVCRQLGHELRLPDLKTQIKWNLVQRVKPSKDTTTHEHLKAVKNGIIQRMANFKLRRLLYKPVSVPGPPPLAWSKIEKPRPRGVFVGKKRN